MMKQIYFALLFLFFPVYSASADLDRHYAEVRIHNEKIEARLADWVDRTIEHSLDMETSSHQTVRNWRQQMSQLSMQDEEKGLRELNRLINGDVRYLDDYTHFHKKDFWADPITVLEEGGDCEDIALLKAASLHRLRWPPDRMHLLVGFLTERGKPESHAVLLVETATGEQYILRSITNQVISPGAFSFTPIYAIDGHGTIITKLPASG